MSVLARELESYQRALDQYRRQAARYNQRADAHNDAAQAFTDSLVRDEQGRPYAVLSGYMSGTHGEGSARLIYAVNDDGTLERTRLPRDMDRRQYELTPAEDGKDGMMLVRHPSSEKVMQEVRGLIPGASSDDGSFGDSFRSGFILEPAVEYHEQSAYQDQDKPFYVSGFGEPWTFTADNPRDQWLSTDAPYATHSTYTATRQASVLPKSPGEWTEEFTVPEPRAPRATLSQVRRMGRPSLARMERGLISDAIRGRGVR